MHALLLDPGGDLDTRPNVYMSAAFRRMDGVGFPPLTPQKLILCPQLYIFRGSITQACRRSRFRRGILASPSFGPFLRSLPVGLAIGPPATLWPSGTLASRDHPLGNNIEFPSAHAEFPTTQTSLGTTIPLVGQNTPGYSKFSASARSCGRPVDLLFFFKFSMSIKSI
jgi:hypothetical protein